MKVALLVTTFNREDALDLVLQSVHFQSHRPDEVIICDDGSSAKTLACVSSWSGELPIKYVWMPNMGFRAARVRNLGILKSQADYLIFVDGDCLLPPSFVERHVHMAKTDRLVTGGRRLLSCSDTFALLTRIKHIKTAFRGWKFAQLPLGSLRDLPVTTWQDVRTCNLSVSKINAESVGGFDEKYIGWGKEDSDFAIRLLQAGFRLRNGRFGACVAHLHHGANSRQFLSANDSLLKKRVRNVDGSASNITSTVK